MFSHHIVGIGRTRGCIKMSKTYAIASKQVESYEISGSHSSEYKDDSLLEYNIL
jgi:hypothetical protein